MQDYLSTIQRSSYKTLKRLSPLPIIEAHISILLHPDEQEYGSSKYELFKVLQLVAKFLIISIRSSYSVLVLAGR